MDWAELLPESQKDRLSAAAAQAHPCVLIAGAPGTGKGQIARWLHLNSPRAKGSMIVAHHLKSLSEQLREANAIPNSTLILQEIGEWPLGDQKALLLHLQSAQAGDASRTRIIATTDQNLEKRAAAGLFNAELYRELSKLRIEMPSLASRAEEFETITHTLLAELARELGRTPPTLDDAAWQKLKAYDWPGNLRELRNVLRIALTTCSAPGASPVLGVKEFPEFGYDRTDFRATRDAFEKTYLQELLRASKGNTAQLAAMTGLSVSTLEAKLKKHGLA
jgi:DNA-binding NtrC family response regulator